MANPNREMDKTHLSLDLAEERGFIHRDYIAHCFRWSHVVKTLHARSAYKTANILDIGCGKDQPLPRLLYSNRMTGFDYCGVDINRLDMHPAMVTAHSNGKIRYGVLEQADASVLSVDDLPWGQATHCVAFEVLEHIQPYIMHRMIAAMRRLVVKDGLVIVSTPVFNGSAAANHINEMSRAAVQYAFENQGFLLVSNYGTFASQSELMPVMDSSDKSLFARLSHYYDSNVLSTFFAPKYPQASRNNLWVFRNTQYNAEPVNTDHLGLNQNDNIHEVLTGRDE